MQENNKFLNLKYFFLIGIFSASEAALSLIKSSFTGFSVFLDGYQKIIPSQ